MSGVLKSVGKVFKKVARTVKKVAPYALAIGAVVLTGGAALGALPAMSTMVGSLGLSAGLSSMITGAVTSAGIGGGLGLLTGGKKGLLKGALVGGLTGGIANGLGAGIDIGAKAATAGIGSTADAVKAASAMPNGIGGAQAAAGSLISPVGSELPPLALGSPSTIAPVATPSLSGGIPAAGGGHSLLSGVGNFIGKNPVLAGNLIIGAGQGISARADARDVDRRIGAVRDSYDDVAYPVFGSPGGYYYDSAAKRILRGA